MLEKVIIATGPEGDTAKVPESAEALIKNLSDQGYTFEAGYTPPTSKGLHAILDGKIKPETPVTKACDVATDAESAKITYRARRQSAVAKQNELDEKMHALKTSQAAYDQVVALARIDGKEPPEMWPELAELRIEVNELVSLCDAAFTAICNAAADDAKRLTDGVNAICNAANKLAEDNARVVIPDFLLAANVLKANLGERRAHLILATALASSKPVVSLAEQAEQRRVWQTDAALILDEISNFVPPELPDLVEAE